MTDDEANIMRPIALGACRGSECQGCHRTLDTIEELRAAVWWPWEKGPVGHPECFSVRNEQNFPI